MSDLGLRYTLPDAETMIENLMEVYDGDLERKVLYPEVAKSAGNQIAPPGVIMMFLRGVQGKVQLAMTLLAHIEQFIDALIDDKDFAKAAKKYAKESLRVLTVE